MSHLCFIASRSPCAHDFGLVSGYVSGTMSLFCRVKPDSILLIRSRTRFCCFFGPLPTDSWANTIGRRIIVPVDGGMPWVRSWRSIVTTDGTRISLYREVYIFSEKSGYVVALVSIHSRWRTGVS
jgi:hypothetical protein